MTSISSPAVLIEAFSSGAGTGNGASVVLLDRPLGSRTLQTLAASLRQSETAFALHWEKTWLLRWFSPTCEVDLCGHATLATVVGLGHWGRLAPGSGVAFLTRSGQLEGSLDQHRPLHADVLLPSAGLNRGRIAPELQQRIERRSGQPVIGYWNSPLGYHVAQLPSGADLEGMTGLAEELRGPERQGLVVMAGVDPSRADGPVLNGTRADYQLRFFAPGLGIPEDPVTGSAHALVAPYWLEQTGKQEVVGWQPSTRPGGMRCRRSCSGRIQLHGTGHLLWDGILHYEAGQIVPAEWLRLLPDP
ncbi:MAG: PhzF family phenazine biosynthesis protein [Cyanobacteriota bacterium]|nr:PhzF family phenazine biosynthesis protein [Cyanobacteriota bacterium]